MPSTRGSPLTRTDTSKPASNAHAADPPAASGGTMRISSRPGPAAGGEKLALGPADAARQLSPASEWIPHPPEAFANQKCDIKVFVCGHSFTTCWCGIAVPRA